MRLRLKTNPVVFTVSSLIILIFLIAGIVATDTPHRFFEAARDGIARSLDWYYILVAALPLSHVNTLPQSPTVQVVLIAIITLAATFFVLFAGPTTDVLSSLAQRVGD